MKTKITVTNELSNKVIAKSIINDSILNCKKSTFKKYNNLISESDFGSLLLKNNFGTFRFVFTQI
jgi:hypothetical protein